MGHGGLRGAGGARPETRLGVLVFWPQESSLGSDEDSDAGASLFLR